MRTLNSKMRLVLTSLSIISLGFVAPVTALAVNNPPVVEPIDDQTVMEEEPLDFTVTSTDPDPSDIVTLTVEGLPDWLTMTDNQSGNPAIIILNGIPEYTDSGSYDLTFTAEDSGSPPLSALESVTITVNDMPEPVFQITVDAAQDEGELPYQYKGSFLYYWPESYAHRRVLDRNELDPGSFRVGVSLWIIDSKEKPENWQELLEQGLSHMDSYFHDMVDHGIHVYIVVDGMPYWLSKDKNRAPNPYGLEAFQSPIYWESPPEDYDTWAEIFEIIVRHFDEVLGPENVSYGVDNEPNDPKFWLGTDREYFKLYEYSVLGARRANLNVKVAGPQVANLKAKAFFPDYADPEDPMLYNFLKYIKEETTLFDLGYPNIIDYHPWNINPSNGYWRKQTLTLRSWLEEFGYDTATIEIYNSEWTYDTESSVETVGTDITDVRQTLAAYIIPAVVAIEEAEVDRPFFHSIKESPDWGGVLAYSGLFVHDWKGVVISSIYNAFWALGKLTGQELGNDVTMRRLGVTENSPNLTAIASKSPDDKYVYLLISNFENRLYPASLANEYLSNQGYSGYQDEVISIFFKNETPSLMSEGLSQPQTVAFLDTALYLLSLEGEDGEKKYIYKEIKYPLIRIIKGELSIKALPVEMQPDAEAASQIYLTTLADTEKINHFEQAYQIYEDNHVNIATQQTVEITLKNLPFAREINYQRYLIDRDHSNSYRYNDDTGGSIDAAVEEAEAEAIQKPKELTDQLLSEKGYSGSDIDLIWQKVEESEGDLKILEQLIQDCYAEFDRYINDPACTWEIVWEELTGAYLLYQKVAKGVEDLFYYGQYNTYTLDAECIDEINNWPGVSLEGSKVENTLAYTDIYTESLTLEPYSVTLIVLNLPN